MNEDNVLNSTGLTKEIIHELQQVLKKYLQIKQVKLYGSRAKATHNPYSDIDLAVYGDDLDRFIIARLLSELNDSDIPYKIDLQDYEKIKNQDLRNHIDRVGIVLYSK